MGNETLDDLLHNAQWAIQLLAKHAHPYNHEYTCITRLTKAVGAVERQQDRRTPRTKADDESKTWTVEYAAP